MPEIPVSQVSDVSTIPPGQRVLYETASLVESDMEDCNYDDENEEGSVSSNDTFFEASGDDVQKSRTLDSIDVSKIENHDHFDQ